MRRRELDPDEQRALFAALPRHHRRLAVFLCQTGLRIGEATALRIDDVTPSHRWIHIRAETAKRGRPRDVPLNQLARDVLDRMGARWTIRGQRDARVFTNPRGRPIQPRAFQRAVRRAALVAGLVGVTPHSFRHTFASALLRAGASVRAVQEILGHKGISSTEIYLHTSAAELAISVDALPVIRPPRRSL